MATTLGYPKALKDVKEAVAVHQAASAPTSTQEGRRIAETLGKPLFWRRWGPYVSDNTIMGVCRPRQLFGKIEEPVQTNNRNRSSSEIQKARQSRRQSRRN